MPIPRSFLIFSHAYVSALVRQVPQWFSPLSGFLDKLLTPAPDC